MHYSCYLSPKFRLLRIQSWCVFGRNCSSNNNDNNFGRPVPLSYLKIQKSPPNETKPMPIFVFHGLFGNKRNWKTLLNQISSRTQQIGYTFDLRNHGESPHIQWDESINGLDQMAIDIKYFMEINHIEKADLIGHSLGGRVVGQFAFNWPEKVNKLIMVDMSPLPTMIKGDFINEDLFEILESSLENLPNDLSKARKTVKEILLKVMKDPFIVDFFILNLHQDPNDGKIKWLFNVDALRTLVSKRLYEHVLIRHPFFGKSLIIYGEQSDYVQPERIEEIREKYLPNVQMIGIPDTGHYLHIQKSAEFIQHTVDFLKSS